MLTNYLKIALRNLRRDKFYSFINILGLTIGITCGLLLLLYVTDELSYDRYHKKADQIYRVVTEIHEPDKTNHWVGIQPPAVKTMKEKYPAVENYVRFFPNGTDHLPAGRAAVCRGGYLRGRLHGVRHFYLPIPRRAIPKRRLDAPGSVVLTQKLAQKFFGSTDALGQTLRTNDTTSYNVTGVIEDVPKNSHFRFNALLSLNTRQQQQNDWGGFYVPSYITLAKGTDPKTIESKSLGTL